jgi:hypothetical protein
LFYIRHFSLYFFFKIFTLCHLSASLQVQPLFQCHRIPFQFTPFPLVSSFPCSSLLGWGKTVHLVRRPLTGVLYQPQMIDDECAAVGGRRIGRGNRSSRRRPALVPLFPPQIAHALTRARTQVAVVGSRQITAWATARS